MKSKAEIADALRKCNDFVNHCSECPYNNNNSNEDCINKLLNDTIILLNKSDFEVMKEILERSEEYHNDYSYEIQGTAILLHRGTQILWFDFDNRGIIL